MKLRQGIYSCNGVYYAINEEQRVVSHDRSLAGMGFTGVLTFAGEWNYPRHYDDAIAHAKRKQVVADAQRPLEVGDCVRVTGKNMLFGWNDRMDEFLEGAYTIKSFYEVSKGKGARFVESESHVFPIESLERVLIVDDVITVGVTFTGSSKVYTYRAKRNLGIGVGDAVRVGSGTGEGKVVKVVRVDDPPVSPEGKCWINKVMTHAKKAKVKVDDRAIALCAENLCITLVNHSSEDYRYYVSELLLAKQAAMPQHLPIFYGGLLEGRWPVEHANAATLRHLRHVRTRILRRSIGNTDEVVYRAMALLMEHYDQEVGLDLKPGLTGKKVDLMIVDDDCQERVPLDYYNTTAIERGTAIHELINWSEMADYKHERYDEAIARTQRAMYQEYFAGTKWSDLDLSKLEDRITADPRFNPFNRITTKEATMSIKIETVTFVTLPGASAQRVEHLTDDQAFDAVAKVEAEIVRLDNIQAKSDKLVKRIKSLRDSVDELNKLIDARPAQ